MFGPRLPALPRRKTYGSYGVVGIDQLGRRIVVRLFLRAGEHAVQRVVVGRGDRIELVIVAAGARDREPHHAAGHDVDAVVDDVVLVVEKPPARA